MDSKVNQEEHHTHLPKSFIEDLSKDIVFEIIGTNNEFINFIFFPNKSIILHKRGIQYFEGGLEFREQQLLKSNIHAGNFGFLAIGEAKGDFSRVINTTAKVAYLGASVSSGKIFVMNNLLNSSVFVRQENLVGFYEEMACSIATPKEFGREKFYSLSVECCSLDSPLTFIQAESSPIEKFLGAGENFQVKADRVIAYSIKELKSVKHSILGNSIKFEGPGVVYIETHSFSRKARLPPVNHLILLIFTFFLIMELMAMHFLGIAI